MLYPKLEDLIAMQSCVKFVKNNYNKSAQTYLLGNIETKLTGQGLNLNSIRLYDLDDDIRHINWRATAKTGKCHVNTYHADYSKKIGIITDNNSHMRFATKGTFKYVLASNILAYLTWFYLSENDPVSSYIINYNKPYHEYSIYDKSSCLQMLKDLSHKNIPKYDHNLNHQITSNLNAILKNDIIYIISDLYRYDLEETKSMLLNLAKYRAVSLIQLTDLSDHCLPSLYNINLKNIDSRLELRHDVLDSDLYMKQHRDYISSLKLFCEASNIGFSTWDTSVTILDKLKNGAPLL